MLVCLLLTLEEGRSAWLRPDEVDLSTEPDSLLVALESPLFTVLPVPVTDDLRDVPFDSSAERLVELNVELLSV